MASTSVVFDIIAHDRASDKFDKLGSSAGGTSSKMSKLGSVMKGAAKAGAIGLGIAVAAVGKGLWEAGQAAIADEKAQVQLATQLRNSTGATDRQIKSVEDWISKTGTMLGVTDDELRPALAKLVTATGDVAEAQDLAALAMDVSAATGKSLESVSTALMKAQNGQISGLSRLGIETTNAKGKTLEFDQVVGQMAATFNGAAVTAANTTAGKMERLKLMFDETKEAIGARLIPIVSDLVGWFMDKGVPAIQAAYAELADRFGPAIQQVAGWVTDKLIPAVVDIAGQLKDTFLPIIERVAHWFMDDLIPAVKGFAEDALPPARKMIDAVKDALSDAQPFFSFLGDIVTQVLIPVLGKLAKTILPVVADMLRLVGKALGKVGELGRWMWNNVLQPVFKLFVEAIGKVLQWFGKMLQAIGKVPKMGWVGDLGDKLVRTGEDADEMGDKIKKIPESHNTKITMDASQANLTLSQLENRLNNLADHLQGMFNGTSGRGSPRTATGPMGAGGIYQAPPPPGSGPGGISNRGVTVVINGALDPVAVGRQVEQVLVKYARATGKPLQVRTI